MLLMIVEDGNKNILKITKVIQDYVARNKNSTIANISIEVIMKKKRIF